MLQELIAIVGLALLCAGWVCVQRMVQKVDPQNPGLDRKCGACGCSTEQGCEGQARHEEGLLSTSKASSLAVGVESPNAGPRGS